MGVPPDDAIRLPVPNPLLEHLRSPLPYATFCSTTTGSGEMRQSRPQLGRLEQEVLHVVLQKPDSSAEHVRGALRRPLRESTVRTVLSRLEQKGYLSHKV